MRSIRRGGRYLRVADPSWVDPLDGAHSTRHGGRWNPAGSFPVCYLNRDIDTARANARYFLERRLEGQPFTVDDFDADELPVLVEAEVPEADFVDVVTDEGCVAAGLPSIYPLDDSGAAIAWAVCQPIGQTAWDTGSPGIACRSAAQTAPADDEELTWFQREGRLQPPGRRKFRDWYGRIDW